MDMIDQYDTKQKKLSGPLGPSVLKAILCLCLYLQQAIPVYIRNYAS